VDDRATSSQLSFKFSLKMALCHVARSMQRLLCPNECDWDRNQKTPVAFAGVADVALTAGVLYGRTQQMKGKL